MTTKTRRHAIAAGMAFAAACAASSASAATCGFTGTAVAGSGVYDPFNPASSGTIPVTLNIGRRDPPGNGSKTATVNIYLQSTNNKADGSTIIPRSVGVAGLVEGLNNNIFYNFGTAGPILQPTASTHPLGSGGSQRFLRIDFTGGNVGSDFAQINFDVTLPPGLDLTAIQQLAFDAKYSCATTGGGGQTDQLDQQSNALVFPIRVLSGVRASYVGTSLEFGEIGLVTTAQAPTINTGNSNYVRVQSSGVYNVTLSSQNAFRLKHPLGSLANAIETVKYKLHFLGLDRDFATTPTTNAQALSVSCARAGVPLSEADQLNLKATLEEGGLGKTPSGNYTDTLTVTVTPQIDTAVSATDCPSL